MSACSLSLTSAVVQINEAKRTLHWILCAAAFCLSWLPAVREKAETMVRIAAANADARGV